VSLLCCSFDSIIHDDTIVSHTWDIFSACKSSLYLCFIHLDERDPRYALNRYGQ